MRYHAFVPRSLCGPQSIPVLVLVVALAGCAGDVPPGEPAAAAGESGGPPDHPDHPLAALAGTAASFQTEQSGQFLTAADGGGGAVLADRTSAQGWETFGVIDRNGGGLESGDLVTLQTENGHYLMATNGGGGALDATSSNQQDWETFRLVRRAGGGTVRSGDIVGLQTLVSGRWVSATNGGGGAVGAGGEGLSTWESFRIGLGGGGGGPSWHLVWQDEFDGSSIDESKWSFDVQWPGWVNHELQGYTRRWENARVENGNLVIEGRHDWWNGQEYTSARLKTQGRRSWTYGRFEARMQLPGGWGSWPAFWMMPDNFSRGWPACGEIDIMEEVGYDQDNVHATTHSQAYNWRSPNQRTSTTGVPGATSGFHVYTADWNPEGIDFFVDGRWYFKSPNDYTGDDAWPFNKNFYIILNLAIGGDWGGAQGVDPNTWPRRMLVDYVRVYQRW